MATLTIIAGLVGSSWVSRWIQRQTTDSRVAIPSKRRSPKAVLDLQIAAPDGSLWKPRLKGPLGETVMGRLTVLNRPLTIRLRQIDGRSLQRIFATASGCGTFPPFHAEAEENLPTVWRLPSPHGLATIRVHLYRVVMDE